ncbi:MAG: hypothetical protein HC929_20090 [Leptolyngbyaceae cyanobacterium SM2_5_2]|nr:hypothetical protein [Leptolyngbyaceae cyanobacterium SM2_5_2]
MDLSLLLAIALLVGLFFWLRRYQARGRARTRGYRRSTTAPSSKQSVNNQTKRELLRLVGGNREVAERLVDQVQLRNPNHSEQWCWEKAIYDIQRDRYRS